MKLYCLKCKAKREVTDIKKAKVGKRNAVKGPCPKCGTTCFQFTAAD